MAGKWNMKISEVLKFLCLLYRRSSYFSDTTNLRSVLKRLLLNLKTSFSYIPSNLPYFILLDPSYFSTILTDRRLKPFEYIKVRSC